MASMRKTFFLVRDFDLPPDGPLQLGSILANPTDSQSILNLNEHVAVPEQDLLPPHVLRNFTSSSSNPNPGLWQKFLQVQGLLDINASTNVTADFSCEELATVSFSPKAEYITQALDKKAVRAYLRHSVLSKSVYMVTGLKIARGAKVSRSQPAGVRDRTEGIADVSFGSGAIPGIHVGIQASVKGLGALSRSKAGQEILSGGDTDCIFAYSVRKITQSRRSLWKQGGVKAGDSNLQPTKEPSLPSDLKSEQDDDSIEPTPIVAEEDETAPDETQPVRILCLDGGGVRGISSLCMLRELMLEVGAEKQRQTELNGGPVKEPECCRPCDYFDLICGTSTGGLIALMLGRMQYTVDRAIDKYSELAKDVFTNKSKDPKAKYDHKMLEEKIKHVIEKALPKIDPEAMLEQPSNQKGCCKVFVVTTLQDHGSTPYLMRTYESTFGQLEPGPFPAKIWEAARATSAAPTFFLPIDIKVGLGTEESPTTTMTFGDGGTTANNPSFVALLEYQSLWPWRPLGCLVSLGTGVEEDARIEEDGRWTMWMLRKLAPSTAFLADVAKYCAQVATSCEKTHDSMEKVMKGLRWKERYFRLNVKYENKKKIELDEFDRIGEMIEDSEEYMMKGGPKGAKEKIGVILVDPESERNRKLDEEWGLHGLILPELQPTMTSSTSSSSEDDKKADPGSSRAGSSDTTAKYNQAGTSNSENRLRENKGDDGKFDLTWAQSSPKLSDIQAVIFYHYDDFGNGWDLAKQPRHGDSVLFDRRDQGESAVAVKVRSKASFVSTNFIKKFKIKPQEVLAVSRNAVRNFLGTQQGVQPDVYINLTFRCRGFNMPKQRATFYILKSDGFDIMFGEDIMMRNSLANQAGIGSQENRDGKQTVVGNLIAKARPLIGRRESQNARGKGKGKERDNDDRDTYASDFRNGPLL